MSTQSRSLYNSPSKDSLKADEIINSVRNKGKRHVVGINRWKSISQLGNENPLKDARTIHWLK